MRLLVSLFLTSSLFFLKSQTPSLLFDSYNAYDQCFGLEQNDDGTVVALQTARNFPFNLPGTFGPVSRFQLPYNTYSNLWHYNATGSVINILPIQSNDDTSYHALSLKKLNDGKFLIGGIATLLNIDSLEKTFYAIANENITEIEQLRIVNNFSTDEYFLNIDEKSNGNIVVYGKQFINGQRDFLIELNRNGSLVSNFYFFNQGIYGITEKSASNDYTMIMYNDEFYNHIAFNIGLINVESVGNVNTFTNVYPNKFLRLNSRGKKLGNRYLINGAEGNEFNLFALKNDSLDLIFSDSLNVQVSNLFHKTFDFIDSNHIYFVSQFTSSIDSNGLVVYSVTSDGVLNWKKFITPYDSVFTFPADIGFIHSICATQDKGVLITFGAADSFGYADSYMLKLDSTGNFTQTFTSITNRKDELTGVSIYPNPSKSKLQVEVKEKGSYTFVLTDALGKIVLSERFENRHSFDITTLPAQIYFYSIIDTKTQSSNVGRFVKE